MTYKELEALNAITGKLQAKTLTVEAFLFLVQLKLELETATLKYKALQAGIYKEYGVQRNIDGSVSTDKYEQQHLALLVEALEALALVEIGLNTKGLNAEEMDILRTSNEMTLAEVALLYRLLKL